MKPWMHEDEVRFIQKYCSPEKVMLEWGAGGSTLYFAAFVKKMYSIEHDEEWYDIIKQQNLPGNVQLFYQPPDIMVEPVKSNYESHRQYIEMAGRLNTTFDLVLIDGRARLACAIYIKQYLTANSVVFIHDFWKRKRSRYRPVLKYYNEIESIKHTLQTIIALSPKL